MSHLKYIVCAIAVAVGLVGCIKNTIPYPVEKLEILSFEGEGFTASIDPAKQEVLLTLDEQTDMTAVKVTKVEITDGATSSINLTGELNLQSPIEVTLSRYQDYVWTIKAQQTIERYFTVAGQVGQTEFDVNSRTAIAYVGESIRCDMRKNRGYYCQLAKQSDRCGCHRGEYQGSCGGTYVGRGKILARYLPYRRRALPRARI